MGAYRLTELTTSPFTLVLIVQLTHSVWILNE